MIDPEDFDDGDVFGINTIGCIFPEKCCMPGIHYQADCHTAEMMEQINKELEGSELHGEAQ